MASFRKRGLHQWQAQIRKQGYPLQSNTFETRAAAARWARAIECEMDRGLFVSRVEAESITLGELLERYVEEVTPLKKGAAPEAARIRALIKHPLANRFLAGLRGVDLARYRDARLKKVSPGTVKRELVILSHLFEVARKEWGIHVHNPVRDIKLPPNPKARDRRLQPGYNGGEDEESQLLRACANARNPFLLPVVRLAIETAMRQGELVRIRWEHVDLNRRTVYLPDTKNGDARTAPLSTTAIRVLRTLPRGLHGQVFPGLTSEAIKRAFMRAVRRAGIKDLRFHDTRHEATTRFFERGLNIMEVASVPPAICGVLRSSECPLEFGASPAPGAFNRGDTSTA